MALADLLVRIGVDTAAFSSGLEKFNSEIGKSAREAEKKFGNIARLGEGLQGVGVGLTAALSLPIAGFATAATAAFAEIDSLKRGLFTLEKSAQGTERRFRELQEVAKLPGLGLEEAVRGDIRLRAIGLSSELSKRALLAFGNALASVGSGKADLDETIRQFGQLATASTLTAENLKPIIERVPQAAQILRTAFGTANAEQLRDLGVTSAQVVSTLISELEKLPPVTGGIKNALENFSDSTKIALASAGEAFAPFVEKALGGLSKLVGEIPKLAKAFTELPEAAQFAAAGIAGVAFVGPLAIVAIGTIIANITQIITAYGALNAALVGVGGVAGLASVALRAIPFVGLAASIYLAIDALNSTKTATDNVVRAQEQQRNSTQNLIDKNKEAIAAQISYGGVVEVSGNKSQGFIDSVFGIGKAKDAVKPKIEAVTAAHKAGAVAVDEHNRAYSGFKRVTFESQALLAQQNILLSEQRKNIEDVAAARLKLSRGQVAIDFGDIPEIETKIKISEIDIPPFDELNDLNGSISSIDDNDRITKAQQDERNRRSEASIKRLGAAYKAAGTVSKRAMQEVSTVLTNLSQGIGQAIFSGEKFGAVFVRIGKQIGASITSFIIQELIRATGILDGFERTLKGVIKNLTGQAVNQGINQGVNAGVNAGVGAAGSAAGTAAGGATSTAGGAASGLSGALGVVNVVASIASAITGAIGVAQGIQAEKGLNAIGLHTLQTANDLANLRRDQFDFKAQMLSKIDDVFKFTWVKLDELTIATRSIGSIPVNAAVSGGGTVNNFVLSSMVPPNDIAAWFDWFATELRRRRIIN